MRITALLENTTRRDDMATEHGLSLYVETGNHRLLYDMGQTGLFARNAETLGIDLSRVDIGILSHGHYDHGGGIPAFLAINGTAPVYVSRFAFEPHYHGAERYIGLDPALRENPRLRFIDEQAEIAPGLTLYHCSHYERRYPIDSSGLQFEQDGALLPEDFRHEQYLLAEEGGKRVLFSGCSHKGVQDIVRWFHPDVLVGGFHFAGLPLDDTLAGYADYLNAFPTTYYTCHCTGLPQFDFMQQRMQRLHYLSCGQTVTL